MAFAGFFTRARSQPSPSPLAKSIDPAGGVTDPTREGVGGPASDGSRPAPQELNRSLRSSGAFKVEVWRLPRPLRGDSRLKPLEGGAPKTTQEVCGSPAGHLWGVTGCTPRTSCSLGMNELHIGPSWARKESGSQSIRHGEQQVLLIRCVIFLMDPDGEIPQTWGK